ncbi:hypothetical protein TrCOL_g1995 [Triparma columacea]|uniref:Aminotransferase class I/classII large domain-containing protein n=1 Tax=Triparma columacea TaxID=722753 RepID=A0A9W7LEL0_9STRA|nr:hypothetical protein TrCOL_g1995 [Triparma columacea]
MSSFRNRMAASLLHRSSNSTLRSLPTPSTNSNMVDFLSNDYLGMSTLSLPQTINDRHANISRTHGSTGSRLLSGNTPSHISLESLISTLHTSSPGNALLFNSGYAANLGAFGCIPRDGDGVVMDEECHNSMFTGYKLSRARGGGGEVRTFKHNCRDGLGEAVRREGGEGRASVVVGLESYYSMSGEAADLRGLMEEGVKAGEEAGVEVGFIVDEAHGTGTFTGRSPLTEVVEEGGGMREHVLCGVQTFGKSVGCHGGAVVDYNGGENGSSVVEYLVNYARPLVYSTSLPPGECERVFGCLEYLNSPPGEERRERLRGNVAYFRDVMGGAKLGEGVRVKGGADGPIQAIMTSGAELSVRLAEWVREGGYDVMAIRAPTVKEGEERIRIVVHEFNTREEILGLTRRVEAFWD